MPANAISSGDWEKVKLMKAESEAQDRILYEFWSTTEVLKYHSCPSDMSSSLVAEAVRQQGTRIT